MERVDAAEWDPAELEWVELDAPAWERDAAWLERVELDPPAWERDVAWDWYHAAA
jgi:hypothetical protein